MRQSLYTLFVVNTQNLQSLVCTPNHAVNYIPSLSICWSLALYYFIVIWLPLKLVIRLAISDLFQVMIILILCSIVGVGILKVSFRWSNPISLHKFNFFLSCILKLLSKIIEIFRQPLFSKIAYVAIIAFRAYSNQMRLCCTF